MPKHVYVQRGALAARRNEREREKEVDKKRQGQE